MRLGGGIRTVGWSRLGRYVILALLVILAVKYVNGKAFLEHLDRSLFFAALLIQPFVFLMVWLTAWRHGLIVSSQPPPLRFTVPAVVLAVGLNVLLPARASEVLKASYLSDHAGLPLSRCIGAVFLERLADLFLVGLMGWSALVLLNLTLSPAAIALALVVPVGAIAVAITGLKILDSRSERASFPAFHSVTMMLRGVADQLTPLGLGRLFGIGLLIWATAFALLAVFVSHAGSQPLSLPQLLAVFVVTTLGSAVPALPGGIGTYQAAGVFILARYGFGLEEALALTTAMQLAIYVLMSPLALIIAFRDGTGLRSIFLKAREAFWASPAKSSKESNSK